ncbi:hypothetical protein [Weissella viridescens]|uniref:hypothetical protein n=1 Tax=Weissella viridescens TaxID=1629 RepID=UPI0035299D1A
MTPFDAYLINHYQNALDKGETSFMILKHSLAEYGNPTESNIRNTFMRNKIHVQVEDGSSHCRVHIL